MVLKILRTKFSLDLAHWLARYAPRSARLKHGAEWLYWWVQKQRERQLNASHYAYFFTEYFGLNPADYTEKKLLDVGCGPRGSLEWADMAKERIGLDPLAEAYLKLGADQHKMRYLKGQAEAIPFPDGYFDVVSVFNALDHVDDLQRAISEVQRVLRKGGRLLLIADIHPYPTLTEPITLDWQLSDLFDQMHTIVERHYEGRMLYKSIRAGIPFDHQNLNKRYGILTALLQKQ